MGRDDRRRGGEDDGPGPVEPARWVALPGGDGDDPLRADLRIPLALRVTTFVGPNAAGKSNVLEALAQHVDHEDPSTIVLHVPAAASPVQLVKDVVRDLEAADVAGGALGRPLDVSRTLDEVFLDEARAVVPEVAKVVVDLDAGVVVARDRHGMPFSASSGLRASLALALARLLAEHGRAPALVAIEEPGAFLHPAAQESLRDRIADVASETGCAVAITSETPFVIPRGPDDLVVALARDEGGHPVVVGEAAGDDPHAGLIGGLFRDPGLGAVLDRAARLTPGTRGVIVFEGGTDEAYLRLAADALGRSVELNGLAVVPAGGASAAALQAVVLRAETDLPLLVILDNDDPGRRARDTLVGRLGFDKRREVTPYAEVLPGYPPGTEAEDMFDPAFVQRFVDQAGSDAITGKRILYGKDERAAWHYDLTSASKSAFVHWSRRNASPDDVPGWARILDLLAERLAPPGRPSPP